MFGARGNWTATDHYVDRGGENLLRAPIRVRLNKLWAACLSIGLSACGPQVTEFAIPDDAEVLPGYPTLGTLLPAGHTGYSNESLADLFVRLTHDLEWGGRRPHLIRYEVPINVGLTGPSSGQYQGFLDRYLAEVRAYTDIPIARGSSPHNLLIRFVPGDDFRTKVPRHVCVVAPDALSWETFRKDPDRYGTQAFERQRKLSAMTVFIPDNAAPWLIRSCLVEEIAQALGPVNDLYGLGPTIFNDDGAHTWPTRLDFLMLKVLYSPGMKTGFSRRTTRREVRAILDTLNPGGHTARPLPSLRQREMKVWAEQLREASQSGESAAARQRAANRALAMAVRRAPGSAYHCHSLIVLARASGNDPSAEVGVLERAERICARAHGPEDIRLARLKLERARATFRTGRASAALSLSENLETTLAGHGQDDRLVAFYALQEAALRAIQQGTRSFRARRQAGAWGAYALGRNNPDVRLLLSR